MAKRLIVVLLTCLLNRYVFALELKNIFVDAAFYSEQIQAKQYPADIGFFNYLSSRNQIVKCSFTDSSDQQIILSVDKLKDKRISYIWDYEISRNGKYILFSSNRIRRYRHSVLADYFIYKQENGEILKINNEGLLSGAWLSPDSKSVVYVKNNNILLYDFINGTTKSITTDGEKNEIINGLPDWLYEEEFSLKRAVEWNKDGSKLAFIKFNEHKVGDYHLTFYDSIYPYIYKYKYPKTGSLNSEVSVFVYDLNADTTIKVADNLGNDRYIPRISWATPFDTLAILEVNREQNESELNFYNIKTGQKTQVFKEVSNTYIKEPGDNFCLMVEKERKFIIKSEKDGYMQLYLYSYDGDSIKRLDYSGYEVNDLLGYNAEKKEVFYSSNENNTTENSIYGIHIETGEKRELTPERGWNNASFSDDCNNFINIFSNVSSPPVISSNSVNNGKQWVIKRSENVIKAMETYGYNPKEISVFNSKNGAFNYYIIKPDKLEKKKKYPLLVFVYGGPESRKVMNTWNGYREEWFQYLVQHGYIVACVDGRGTGGKGKAFREGVYKKLGTEETEDQIEFARYLGHEAYIDTNRIGIFGWSYGGFLSLLCLQKGNDVFKTGISVAPITDWKFYDSAYTERFMKKPAENEKGYNASSVLTHVESFNHPFLLVHGVYDDNVHIQHSMELIKEMARLNKKVDLMVFPDNDHNINYGNNLLYLYEQMSDYLFKNL